MRSIFEAFEIERRFSVIDAMEKTVDDSLVKAERLRQSILKKAFEGRLVPQNPDDEPASVLLKRIQAEKKERAAREKGQEKAGKAKLKPGKAKLKPGKAELKGQQKKKKKLAKI